MSIDNVKAPEDEVNEKVVDIIYLRTSKINDTEIVDIEEPDEAMNEDIEELLKAVTKVVYELLELVGGGHRLYSRQCSDPAWFGSCGWT